MNDPKPELIVKEKYTYRFTEESITVFKKDTLVDELPWDAIQWKYTSARYSSSVSFWRDGDEKKWYPLPGSYALAQTFWVCCPNKMTKDVDWQRDISCTVGDIDSSNICSADGIKRLKKAQSKTSAAGFIMAMLQLVIWFGGMGSLYLMEEARSDAIIDFLFDRTFGLFLFLLVLFGPAVLFLVLEFISEELRDRIFRSFNAQVYQRKMERIPKG